jgi:hypothetical protein
MWIRGESGYSPLSEKPLYLEGILHFLKAGRADILSMEHNNVLIVVAENTGGLIFP